MPLVLVAMPVEDGGDLPPRAAAALAAADAVLRVDDLIEPSGIDAVLERLRRDETVVVVTDAGTPGMPGTPGTPGTPGPSTDAGEGLVRAVAAADLPIEVVPGPSAAVAALVASGLPTGRFVVEGFLPGRGSVRAARLAELATERRTIVLHESPDHLARTLADLAEALGADRRVAIGRQRTELPEEVRRTTLAEAAAWAASAEAREPDGEVVVVIDGGPAPAAASAADVDAAVATALAEGLSPRDAAARVAGDLGVPKRDAYAAAVGLTRKA